MAPFIYKLQDKEIYFQTPNMNELRNAVQTSISLVYEKRFW